MGAGLGPAVTTSRLIDHCGHVFSSSGEAVGRNWMAEAGLDR
jgi:hypothetical protein